MSAPRPRLARTAPITPADVLARVTADYTAGRVPPLTPATADVITGAMGDTIRRAVATPRPLRRAS
jgi:hypothetical protein